MPSTAGTGSFWRPAQLRSWLCRAVRELQQCPHCMTCHQLLTYYGHAGLPEMFSTVYIVRAAINYRVCSTSVTVMQSYEEAAELPTLYELPSAAGTGFSGGPCPAIGTSQYCADCTNSKLGFAPSSALMSYTCSIQTQVGQVHLASQTTTMARLNGMHSIQVQIGRVHSGKLWNHECNYECKG